MAQYIKLKYCIKPEEYDNLNFDLESLIGKTIYDQCVIERTSEYLKIAYKINIDEPQNSELSNIYKIIDYSTVVSQKYNLSVDIDLFGNLFKVIQGKIEDKHKLFINELKLVDISIEKWSPYKVAPPKKKDKKYCIDRWNTENTLATIKILKKNSLTKNGFELNKEYKDLRGLDLRNPIDYPFNLEGIDLSFCDIYGNFNFRNCDLFEAKIDYATIYMLTDSILVNSKITIHFGKHPNENTICENNIFDFSIFTTVANNNGMRVLNCSFKNSKIKDVKGMIFENCNFENCSFNDANLSNVTFLNSNFQNATFNNTLYTKTAFNKCEHLNLSKMHKFRLYFLGYICAVDDIIII